MGHLRSFLSRGFSVLTILTANSITLSPRGGAWVGMYPSLRDSTWQITVEGWGWKMLPWGDLWLTFSSILSCSSCVERKTQRQRTSKSKKIQGRLFMGFFFGRKYIFCQEGKRWTDWNLGWSSRQKRGVTGNATSNTGISPTVQGLYPVLSLRL